MATSQMSSTVSAESLDMMSNLSSSPESSMRIYNSNSSTTSTSSISSLNFPNCKIISSGRFAVFQTLGSGATGKVKLGIDTQTGERVALKLMALRSASTRQSTQILREIRSMKMLNHPNILALKYVDLNLLYPKRMEPPKPHVLLVLELAEGGELFDYMMYSGSFSEPLARAYAVQLISAMNECHSKGVYHRDLKPENLLLDSNFNLKIADFGFASNLLSRLTSPDQPTVLPNPEPLLTTECGTRSYMAPEVLAHQPYTGSSADAWSLGCVLFILLMGNPPFQIADMSDWWFCAIKNGRADRFWKAHMRTNPNISEGARAFLLKLLEPDSEKRCTMSEIFQDEWLNDVNGRISNEEVFRQMIERKRCVEKAKEEEKIKAFKAQERERENNKAKFDPFAAGNNIRRSAAKTSSESKGKEEERNNSDGARGQVIYVDKDKVDDLDLMKLFEEAGSHIIKTGVDETGVAVRKFKSKSNGEFKVKVVGGELRVERRGMDVIKYRSLIASLKNGGNLIEDEEEDLLEVLVGEGGMDMI